MLRIRSLDAPRVWEALARRGRWILIGGFALGLLGLVAGYVTANYTATATLIRNEIPASLSSSLAAEGLKLRDYSVHTLADIIQSPGLWERVATNSGLPVTPDDIAARCRVSLVPGTDLLRLSLCGKDPQQTVLLLHIYAKETVRLIQGLQADEAKQLRNSLAEKLHAVDRALETANQELTLFQRATGVIDFEKETASYLQQRAELDLKSETIRIQLETLDSESASLQQEIAKHHPALLSERQALDQALLRYTEEHPKVKELKARVASIEAQLAGQRDQIDPEVALQGSSLAKNLYTKLVELRTQRVSLSKQLEKVDELRSKMTEKLKDQPEKQLNYVKVKSHYESLKTTRDLLLVREREAQLFEANAAGSYRIFELPKTGDEGRLPKFKAALWFGLGAAILGFLATSVLLVALDLSDKRIRSEADLRRVTCLPILATLGHLEEMSDGERDLWAFQTLTALKGKLRASLDQTLVCGFISSRPGEGRSTWVNLLAAAASKRGYRVLTIVTNRFEQSVEHSVVGPDSEHKNSGALLAPSEISQALVNSATQPVVEIPLPGWVWSLERRKQWQQALRELHSVNDLVVLVELPPASEPEALLLSEDFPHLIWLCGQDMAEAAETYAQLEILKQCRSGLVGAVLNRATPARRNKRGGRSMAGILLALSLLANSLQAQPVPPPAADSNPPNENPAGFSMTSSNQLAWQKHLTLGPGDSLSISMYDQPDTGRPGLFIGPDGRLNYLQARDVMAAGLTVDELRERLEQALSKYYRPPIRIIVIPEAYRSKKYYLLGGVVQKGVFALDRPITVLEAIARAKGFEAAQRNTLLLADLSRSFLIRRIDDNSFTNVSVDFEGLFLRADLSQNIGLAPDDFLYFPPVDLKEVYVLGEVRNPGVVPYTPETTFLRALVSRGGFNDRAYTKKVIIVRGSLNNPQAFVINAADILSAKATDVALQPRDIIYVHHKPWQFVKDLLKFAISEYARSLIITWAGQNVGPFTTEPFIPSKNQ